MGKEYLKGLKDGLGGKMAIVAEAPYKVTDTTIDAPVAKLKASGADVLIEFTTPKFAVHGDQADRRTRLEAATVRRLDFQFVLGRNSAGGPAKCGRPLSAAYRLEGEDAAVAGEAVFREWSAFMQRYLPQRQQGQRPGRSRLSGRQVERSRS